MFNLSLNSQGKPKDKQKGRRTKRWRLFHANDFQSLMYPCFILCRILGIFPYKIIASTFKISKSYYIVETVICVYCIYGISFIFNSFLFGKLDMTILPGNFLNMCISVFGGFIMIVTLVLSGPRMRLLQIILKISSRLPAESYQKLSKLIHTKDIIGFLILLGITSIQILVGQISFLFYVHIILVVFQMDMLYVNCVCVLKICFKRINDDLAHMQELMTNYDSFGSVLIYHEQRNPFLIMELKALMKEYLTISDTVHMLNMIFSLQLLTTVLITFLDMTMILYYYILLWQYILSMNTLEKTFINTMFLLRFMYHVIKIGLIIWACETSKNQALQIITSIHDILNIITDDQIKEEVV